MISFVFKNMEELDLLINELNQNWFRIKKLTDYVKPGDIICGNPGDPNEVKGRLVEKYVEILLQTIPDLNILDSFPESKYDVKTTNSGVEVYSETRLIHEFDFVFTYHGLPIISEVKAGKLNGVGNKIARGISIAEDIFRTDVGAIIFSTFNHNRGSNAAMLQQQYANLRCFDLRYKKKELETALKVYCQ